MELSARRELAWAGGVLLLFLALFVVIGLPQPAELVLFVAAYSSSWVIVSYAVRTFGAGSFDNASLEKEMGWFGGVLLLFLAFLTLVGVREPTVFVIATAAFSISWFVRSIILKRLGLAEVLTAGRSER
ncbi:MAG: hypothetical protein QF366_01420 [Candidatus Poseidoniia archaeon]|jgi:hypothetical protein|nr:hypothetical protein [Candidatus Poseidoniia archaeon]MDP6658729.1 hypothetical protein [Candidatus Poseidoniia archaeon]MDP6846293.1 hypothetical protein [Candidatus Poseidoniia archaeon]MDP7007040.1 hypothetical protein [Candidatus Poseidoniia archaeon]|tara:strand:+ start:8519 stop:8905 length:387 start_codon:yes stop_codon:yes gene_type:complete